MATNYHIPNNIDFPPGHKLNRSRLGYVGAGVLVLAILSTSVVENGTQEEPSITMKTSLEKKKLDPISDNFPENSPKDNIVDGNPTEE